MEYVQNDIFSELYPKFTITKPIRLIELFAGIGSQAKALKRIGANFEHWRAIEFDKYAMASYNAVHGTNFETTDICDVHAADLGLRERERYCYIMTYSFPCQDLSVAGHQKGMAKGSGTRSGLLWEVERILDECNGELPQVMLMENVPMVIAEKNLEDFYAWRGKLESLGYSSYVQILNAKDYEVPQNRARCFMVSILGEYSYEFPKKKPLKYMMKDFLEEEVDEKFYLTEKQIAFYKANSEVNAKKGNGFRFTPVERERERLSKTVQTKMDRPEVTWIREYLKMDSSTMEPENIKATQSMTQTESQEHSKLVLKPETHSRLLSGGYQKPSEKADEEALTGTVGISSKKINRTGFIDKGTGQHQSNEVFSQDGLARSIQARDFKGAMMIEEE